MILLLLCITNSAQSVYYSNENEFVIEKKEFQRVIKIFAEYNSIREILLNLNKKVDVMNREIFGKDSVIVQQRKIIDIKNQEIKIIKPAWYDNFLYGFISCLLISFGIIIFLK
jgi:hypothetical protein